MFYIFKIFKPAKRVLVRIPVDERGTISVAHITGAALLMVLIVPLWLSALGIINFNGSNNNKPVVNSEFGFKDGDSDKTRCQQCGPSENNYYPSEPSPHPSGEPADSAAKPMPKLARSYELPAQVLDLSNWKLTLPTAESGSKDASEIPQPVLGKYTNSKFFFTQGDSVVFRANADGATTKGSHYPRSELREMNGTKRAEWSTTAGTHTMTVNEAVMHLPVAKPEVTTAQVHDSSDDVIVVRLEGKHLFAEHDSKNLGDIDMDYKLGTFYTIKYVASDGHIRIYYNGELKADYVKKGTGNYFKAGCYTQSNTTKGDAADAYGEVQIKSLSISHT